MEFTEYEKMTDDISKFEDSKLFKKYKWMVTEKVHGANFSFHTDGKHVYCARRRSILDPSENFMNHQTAKFMETYPDKMKDVFVSVSKLAENHEITQVSVYGELFGGKYVVDGKDLNTSNHKAIQQEIQYSPTIEWIAFDISYRTKENPQENEYLDPSDSIDIFEEHKIFYLKPLFVGSMNEALNYQIGFDSTIPGLLHLPQLGKETNTAEGIVVKPIKNLKGIFRKDEARVIVKIKSSLFEEVVQKQPVKTSRNGEQKGKPRKQNLLQRVMACCTEQRFNNAISKIGHPSTSNREDLLQEFIADIFADIKENDDELHDVWTKSSEQNKIKDILRHKGLKLIQQFENSSG